MATKSILKTISIKEKKTCSNFIKAIEAAQRKSCHEKRSDVQYREPKASEIKDLFS